jgi:hypothetical protein
LPIREIGVKVIYLLLLGICTAPTALDTCIVPTGLAGSHGHWVLGLNLNLPLVFEP